LQEKRELLPARYRLYDRGGGGAGVMNWFADWANDVFSAPLLRRGTDWYG
jgi:hypothetical protein